MAEIIARFADGKLLVQEDKAVEQGYKMSGYSTYGVPFRIGHIKTVEKVISLDAYVSGYPGHEGKLGVGLRETKTSGDTILVVLRRADAGAEGEYLSGHGTSGAAALNVLSGITSGLAYWGELTSGLTAISGLVKIQANVIGY